MVPPVPLGCHAQGLTVNVGPPSSAYQKPGRSLAQLNNIDSIDERNTYESSNAMSGTDREPIRECDK